MKKQILVPVFVVLLGISAAFASHRLTPEFYPLNDSDCSEQPIAEPCTPGTQVNCTVGSATYYYIPDVDADEPVCTVLKRNTTSK